jgi:hypothetical protein
MQSKKKSLSPKIVSAVADMEHRKMLQYFPKFKLPHGNAAFGERRLPETGLSKWNTYGVVLFNNVT